MKPLELTGQVFGYLTALQRAGSNNHRQAKWMFQCRCGKQVCYKARDVVRGSSTSCGCKRKAPRLSRRLDEGKAASNSLYRRYAYDANKRQIFWDLPLDVFLKITSDSCYYCGALPFQIVKGKSWNGQYTYNGVDRQDSSLGYVKENVVACCATCNYAKASMTFKLFKEWIARVHKHLGL